MTLRTRLAYKGSAKSIELLVLDDGQCAVADFLEGLDSSQRRKVDVLFELLGEKGAINNREKFKKLEGTTSTWEFKSFQVRLLCFMAPGHRVIICRGLIKKTDKHSRADIDFAEDCRAKFLGVTK
jgi:hypothetical protein